MIALLRYSVIVLSVGYWVIGWCPLIGAQTISSTELIQDGKAYDAKEIVYQGEVIGEVMKRKDGVWVNIYDKQNSIGVWMTPESASIIEYAGSYKAKGDILRVRGIFNYNCPLHGGDLDIHASSLQKIKSGYLKQKSRGFSLFVDNT